ncbi:deacetylase SIR2, partial [Staphylococcus aureus]
QQQDDKVMYLEIGIGTTTPQFAKHPFQPKKRKNANALYMPMIKEAYRTTISIKARTIHSTAEISNSITEATRNDRTTTNNNIG